MQHYKPWKLIMLKVITLDTSYTKSWPSKLKVHCESDVQTVGHDEDSSCLGCKTVSLDTWTFGKTSWLGGKLPDSQEELYSTTSYFVIPHCPWYAVFSNHSISAWGLNVMRVYTWSASVSKTGHTTEECKNNEIALRLCRLEWLTTEADNSVNQDIKYSFRTQSCYTMPAVTHKATKLTCIETVTKKRTAR